MLEFLFSEKKMSEESEKLNDVLQNEDQRRREEKNKRKKSRNRRTRKKYGKLSKY